VKYLLKLRDQLSERKNKKKKTWHIDLS